MAPQPLPVIHEKSWNDLQARIERLKREKKRLLDEWELAVKQIYHAPAPYRYDALQTVGDRYADLVDVIEGQITTLKISRGEFTPRIERLLMRTGRPGYSFA
ncbi:MAG: hypothetical protein B6I34_02830 [Anaerolineaceae bacterium 4572_32.1]|nr:MAG: hypothetical protein B6I34_02830 [Anaerolineaceae bacterium 4572_32.1]